MFDATRILSTTSPVIPLIAGQPSMVPVSISGTEAVNALSEFKICFATPDIQNYRTYAAANANLDDFIGHELTIAIQLEGNGTFIAGMPGGTGRGNIGAGVREISGLISDAKFLREEGRHALYELTIRPWLYLATLSTDCKIFQDKTAPEVLDIILAAYPFPVEKRLSAEERYPKRDIQMQYNETDFAFFSRLCEEWGISYWFEHSDGAHRLILGDCNSSFRQAPSEAYHELAFYTEGKKIDEETIHAFTPARKLVSGVYKTTEYDYTRPRADLTVSNQVLRPTALNNLEQYEYHASANYSQPKAGAQQEGNDPFDEGKFISAMRMQAISNAAQRGSGSGHLRGLPTGCITTIKGHPQQAANIGYIVLSTTLTIVDVSQETQRSDGGQQYRVDCDFEVCPVKGPDYHPERITPKPVIHTATALVVGPENQPIWTDQYGRIKIQFTWDRVGQNDQNSSIWIRTSEMWSGNQLGSTHLPRIGSEAILSFISGDVDQPIIIGYVNNQNNLPPWQLPSQQALSGT
ncbi:type VI secretion system Vgr family protein, partial [Glaciimonas soli]|uniref:type VI secretion system Vgr family protein n=1 Tax=Glaciimonas soli TaxID=2590999 RepID=UPI0018856319